MLTLDVITMKHLVYVWFSQVPLYIQNRTEVLLKLLTA